jgi:putative thioredoxin
MGTPSYIVDATAENFRAVVLENSDKGPVLVNYWSPRAGPCMMLLPRLIRLATEYHGRFLLALLNTDEYGALAREQGVVSVPTVKVFRSGRVVDTLHGAESEANLRAFIGKHVPAKSASPLYRQAIEAYQRGDLDGAVRLAAEAALAEPDNLQIPLDLAKLLMLAGRFPEASQLLKSLPEPAKDNVELRHLAAHLDFISTSQNAPAPETLEQAIASDPGNLEARYQLAAAKVVQDDYEGAMDQLLEIVRRDSAYRDDAARNGLLALFQMLGPDDARVRRYQSQLADAMH